MPHFGLTDATRLLSAAPNPLSAGRNDAELASPSTTIRYAVHQQRTDVIVFAYVIPLPCARWKKPIDIAIMFNSTFIRNLF